jgi:hypothetical protein
MRALTVSLAAIALSMSEPAAAQAPQPTTGDDCFWLFFPNREATLGAILLDRCTGKTWRLNSARTPDGKAVIRWFPLHTESNEWVTTTEAAR